LFLGVISLCSLLAMAPIRAGDPAPLVAVVDLDGRPVSLEPDGQVVIVDFFATWCPRCRESVTRYQDIIAALGNRVRIVVIDVKEPAAVARRFFDRIPLPDGVILARDPRGTVMRNFGATGFPSFYVIDPRGTVRDVSSGWGEGTADYLVSVVRWILSPPRRGGARSATRPPRQRGKGRDQASEATSFSADEKARRMGVEILH
jgi:thiol-disulfide isomerase/thioredoxin